MLRTHTLAHTHAAIHAYPARTLVELALFLFKHAVTPGGDVAPVNGRIIISQFRNCASSIACVPRDALSHPFARDERGVAASQDFSWKLRAEFISLWGGWNSKGEERSLRDKYELGGKDTSLVKRRNESHCSTMYIYFKIPGQSA